MHREAYHLSRGEGRSIYMTHVRYEARHPTPTGGEAGNHIGQGTMYGGWVARLYHISHILTSRCVYTI